MERWEPPKTIPAEVPRRKRQRTTPAPRELPEIWLMVATRVGITLVFALAVVLEGLRNQMHFVGLVTVAGLIVLIRQSDQVRTRRLRDQCILDTTILLTVVPVAIFAGFVAAETGELLPAERSAYIQTSIATIVALAVVMALGYRLFAYDRPLLVSMILPAFLVTISLAFVLHDYRNQTVMAMLAVSYLVGGLTIALGIVVEDPFRRYLPGMFYAATLVVGLVMIDPGLGNLSEREGLIQAVTLGLIAFGLLALIILPQASLQPGKLLLGLSFTTRTQSRRRRRSIDDPGRRTQE